MSGVFAARIGAGGVTGAPAAGGTARMLCLADGDVPERTAALAFERDGERALPALGGRFALLLWDRARAAGVLARDPLGHRSVFYARAGDDLLVASELRALLELLPSTPGPDEVSVAHWLAGTGVPVGRTLYAGVRRLPPGSLLRVGEDEPQRWWSPAAGEGPSEAQAPEFLRAAMASAVERALAGAERPAVLLSGGFDSGSIAALAGAPATYSGVFPDHPGVDESAAIALTTAHVGAHGSERRFEDASALAACAEFLLEHHVPPASPNGFVWRPLIRGAAADGITRMLDGEGGDELFGCAPFLIADALRAGRPDRALALARSLPGMGPRPRRSWVAQALRRYGLRGALPPALHAALRRRRAFAGPGTGWLREPLDALHRETHDPWAWKHTRGPRWRAALLHALVDGSDALTAHDQLRLEARLCGIEFAHPFRDPQLLEQVLRIDPALAFDATLDRPLARRAMAGLLPDAVRLSDRKPHFNPVIESALCGTDAALVRRLLGDRRAEVRAYVRQDALDGLAAARSGALPARELMRLWRALALECWLLWLGGRHELVEDLALAGGVGR